MEELLKQIKELNIAELEALQIQVKEILEKKRQEEIERQKAEEERRKKEELERELRSQQEIAELKKRLQELEGNFDKAETVVEKEPEKKQEQPQFCFCTNCGQKLPADSRFCYNCGTAL